MFLFRFGIFTIIINCNKYKIFIEKTIPESTILKTNALAPSEVESPERKSKSFLF